MPLLTLHLLRLQRSQAPAVFLKTLHAVPSVKVIVASEPQHVVIKPTFLDAHELLAHPWDILILLKSPDAQLPTSVRSSIETEYKVSVGVPSKLLASYPERNRDLRQRPHPKLSGSLDAIEKDGLAGGERLEVSQDLLDFMLELESRRGKNCPVTMLNFLHFHPGGKKSYGQYGRAFVPVAQKRGGDAKIVGNVVPPPKGTTDTRGDASRPETEWWNEISIVHYPRYVEAVTA